MLSLKSKTAFVTGGAKRIGRQIALSLAEAGADVAIAYRNSQADAEETARAVEAFGVHSMAVKCDVRSEKSVRCAVADVVTKMGRLDVLVNNAAVFESASFEDISLAQWDAVFETNVRGPFWVSREALPHLKAARGRIIHIGSLGGMRAWAGHAHYCSSKAALHMLTQTMAKALAPDVSVNCVAPGWVEMDAESREMAKRFAEKTPMGRNGTAEDIAKAVVFFAAGIEFVTGQILVVDGGLGL